MFLLSLSSICRNSSNSVEQLTQFLWDEYNAQLAQKRAMLSREVVQVEEEEVYDEHYKEQQRKVPTKKAHCIKLSKEQALTLADWHDCTIFGSRCFEEVDFTDDGKLVHVGIVKLQSAEFYKLVDLKGQKLVFHHWKKGQKASKRLRNAWRWADVIICCHSATIPSEYRHKVAVYSGGVVSGNRYVIKPEAHCE